MVKTKHHGNTSDWGESNRMRRPNKPDLERSILSCLSRQRVSLKALQIAKAVGMVTAKDVNPTLYSLAKVNKVICVVSDGRAPVWRLGALPMDATSTQPGFSSSSSSWNVVTQCRSVSSYSVPTDVPVNDVLLPQSDISHSSGFHCGAALVGRSAGRGLLGLLGGSTGLHAVGVDAKPMSETETVTPGEARQSQRSLGDQEQFSDAGKCIREEQSDGDNLEKLMMSCEPGTEEDEKPSQDDLDVEQGHCDTEMAGDVGDIATGQRDPDIPAGHSDLQMADDVREAADDGETSSGDEGEKDDTSTSAMINDQVRLLRALSTSDDDSNSSCPGDFIERTPVFSIGQCGSISQDTPLQKSILQHMAMSSRQHCSTLHLTRSLHLGCKKDLNATLYNMNKCGLIAKVNEMPPLWQMTPAGRCLLQDQASDSIPTRPTSLTSDAAFDWSLSQEPIAERESSPFRIPLSPAEMMRSRSLIGSTGGASGSSSPLGVCREPLVYQRIGIGRGIQLVQNTQTVGEDDSQKLLNALKMHEPEPLTSVAPLVKTGTQNTHEALTSLSSESFAALNKNPVSALMEFAQTRKMTATVEVFGQTGPSHNPRFRMAAVMGSRQFPYVTVTNKKDGKKEAAEVALRILMSEEQINMSNTHTGPVQAALNGLTQATHFDKMAALCHQAFHLVISGVTISMPGRKVMAGLVMKTGPDDDGKVICLGSGNRCITGESLSLEGQTVNDSHAEIITRRGFLRFLYRQLQTHASGDPETIFEDATSGKLRVKPGITFHLYITTAPCGDGALMSQRDAKPLVCCDDGNEHHPTFSSAVMGLLRTKIEGGEGTLPIKSDFVEQTWDGIIRGERLRTMSCSDKICRWNVVGMQGALLSHFLEPIYLGSLTLGYLYEESHLSRAVCCRLVHGEPDVTTQLQSPYHVNHPQLGRVTMCDAQRETQKTKQYSVNWCEGDATAEVTDGTRGICLDGMPSQVCKSALYRDFKTTCEKLGRSDLLQSATYLDAKQNAAAFQEAKRIMVMKFKATGFGMWVSKPVEEKMFK